MNIYILALSLIALFLILRFGVLPMISKQDVNQSKGKFIRTKVWILTIEKLTNLAFLGMVTFCCFILLFWLIKLFSNIAYPNTIRHLIDFFGSVYSVVSFLGGPFTIAIIIISLIIFLILSAKHLYRQYTEEFKRKFDIIYEQYQEGKSEDIPYTPEMIKIQEAITTQTEYISNEIADLQRMFFAEVGEEELNEIIARNTQERFEYIDALKNRLLYLDIERRITFDDETQPANQKVNFFLSQGFSSILSKSSNLVTKISFVVFLLSLITFQTDIISKATEKDLTIQYFEANKKELQKQLDAFSETPYIFTKADEDILNEIAYDFEIAVSYNRCWETDELSDDNTYLIKSLIVREEILKSFVDVNEKKSKENVSEYSDNTFIQTELSDESLDLPPFYLLAYADFLSNTDNVKAPKTELGKTFKTQLKDVASKSGKHWTDIKTNFERYKSSFHKPATIKNVRSVMFSNLTMEIIDAENIVQKVGSIVSSENIGLLNENLSTKFTKDLIRNYDYLESLQKLRNMPAEEVFGNQRFAQQINKVLPKVSDISVSEIINSNPPALKTVSAKNNATLISSLEKFGMPEPLTTYEDFFPGQMGNETKTERAKSEKRIETRKQSHTPKKQTYHTPRNVKTNFARARSVKMLRGFSRVGGVLIGELPNDSTKLNYVDIKWNTTKDGKINIKLIDNRGRETNFGTFSKSVIKRALVYSADGRPTAVTMVNVNIPNSLKILLHPALVNSEIGINAINIDRFVDIYTSNTKEIQEERDFVRIQNAIYKSLSIYNYYVVQSKNNNISKIERMYFKNLRDTILIDVTKLKEETEIDKYILKIQREKLNSQNSALVAKSYYFDQALVNILNSAKGNTYKTYILDAFKLIDANPIFISNKQSNNYEVWSGVREKEYGTKDFFNRNEKSNPFNFILQTSIIIPEDSEDFIEDEVPWQFPLLYDKDLINKTVFRNINLQDTYSLQQMQKFCTVQRLFRLAFEGKFGNQFPIEKLVHLFNEVKNENDYQQTDLWSRHFSKKEFEKGDREIYELYYQLGILE